MRKADSYLRGAVAAQWDARLDAELDNICAAWEQAQVGGRIRYQPPSPVHPLIDAALATAQAALEPPAFAEAFAAGQQFTLTEAFVTLQSPLN